MVDLVELIEDTSNQSNLTVHIPKINSNRRTHNQYEREETLEREDMEEIEAELRRLKQKIPGKNVEKNRKNTFSTTSTLENPLTREPSQADDFSQLSMDNKKSYNESHKNLEEYDGKLYTEEKPTKCENLYTEIKTPFYAEESPTPFHADSQHNIYDIPITTCTHSEIPKPFYSKVNKGKEHVMLEKVDKVTL